MSTGDDLIGEFRVEPGTDVVNLAGFDPARTVGVDDEDTAEDELENDLAERLFDQHELLFANADRSVLLVLQGTDCSGKNGTIKHVVITMNPAGVRTASWREPTEEERRQHFLTRYRGALPRPGELGVFDRSHYEDAIVPAVNGELGDDEVADRLDTIVGFEKELVDAGTIIVKCLLHISYDEQRERFLRRLRREDKRWKFALSDLETRRHWDDYQAAYGRAVAATSTEHAPWLVIPADHKWYRNWAIAHILVTTFASMDLSYPQPDFDLDDLRARLEPPN